jgi:hypothetical protein
MADGSDEIADSRVPGLLLLLVWNRCLDGVASRSSDRFAYYDHGPSFSGGSRAIEYAWTAPKVPRGSG